MKNLLTVIAPAALCAIAGACASDNAGNTPLPRVEWSSETVRTLPGEPAQYVQTFRVWGMPDSMSRLAFNMFARQMEMENPADTLVEIVPGYYTIASPRLSDAVSDTVEIRILTRGRMRSVCYSPDGVHGIGRNGGTFDVDFRRFDLLDDSVALAAAPLAEDIYRRNAELTADAAVPSVYEVVPSFKKVTLTGGETRVNPSTIEFKAPDSIAGESYSITVAEGKITLTADSSQWKRLGMRLRHFWGDGERTMPAAEIHDAPDLEYRGLMVDIARNFQRPEEIKRVLDLMAVYGLNVFHFHITDDEAWRLQVRSLPELTDMGSRRGYAPTGNESFLPQIFAGNGNPDAVQGTANGFINTDEFVDIVRYANGLGITVIPEIESPGHARAAIKAMAGREEFRMTEPGDTSKYTSAQAFHDNVMNPALDGTYRFMEKVVDELVALYGMAGVPLKAIHIGGDEVPRHCWDGSDAVRRLMAENNLPDQKAVHAYFVERVARYIASKGVGVSGWQEVALRHPKAYTDTLRPLMYSVNCWSTLPHQGQAGVVDDIYRDGFPVILSNVDHFYLDMCYSPHPDERGLSWGGYVDEFDALAGTPSQLMSQGMPKGIQGQVFAETIRGPRDLEVMLLPKMAGLAERAWNTAPTYSEATFNSIIDGETARWDADGYAFHVRQPGAVITADGRLMVNSSYTEADIRYTTDGTNPEADSPAIEAGHPVDIDIPAGGQIRVRQWVHGQPSVVTVLKR